MKLVPIKVAGRELEPHKAVVDPLIGSSTVPANRQHELQIGDGFVTLMALGVPSVFRLVLPSARSGRDSPHNARAPSTASFAPEHIVTPMDGDMRAHTFVWDHPPLQAGHGRRRISAHMEGDRLPEPVPHSIVSRHKCRPVERAFHLRLVVSAKGHSKARRNRARVSVPITVPVTCPVFGPNLSD
jgi:hypothetical protein